MYNIIVCGMCELFLISDNIVVAPAATHQYVSCCVVSGMRREFMKFIANIL